jgi:hypothetical protein
MSTLLRRRAHRRPFGYDDARRLPDESRTPDLPAGAPGAVRIGLRYALRASGSVPDAARLAAWAVESGHVGPVTLSAGITIARMLACFPRHALVIGLLAATLGVPLDARVEDLAPRERDALVAALRSLAAGVPA